MMSLVGTVETNEAGTTTGLTQVDGMKVGGTTTVETTGTVTTVKITEVGTDDGTLLD
jgi:hypothetical protein